MFRFVLAVLILLLSLLPSGCASPGNLSVMQQVYGSDGAGEKAEEVDDGRLPLKRIPVSATMLPNTTFKINDIND